jgi:hypothetical protein
MNALVIDKVEYEFPTDFKVRDWLPLTKVDNNAELLIELALKVPRDMVNKMPSGTKNLMHQMIRGVLYPQFVKLNKEVDGCKLIALNEVKLGQFIDLEVMLENIEQNLPQIVNILYNTDRGADMMVSEVYASLQYYINYRKSLYTNYKNLFNAPSANEEVVDYKQDKTANTAHIWFDIVMTLADGRFLDMESVLDRPVVESFNWLSWNKDKRIKENEQLRKQLNK